MSSRTREQILEEAKHATLLANLAETRLRAWLNARRALIQLKFAYEGNDFAQVVESWFNAATVEKAARDKNLQSVLETNRELSARLMNEYDETPGF